MTTRERILWTEGLRKTFGELVATNDVTLSFREGEITAVIGPNGAGKSTFFNLLTGRIRPTAGEIHFAGERITGLPPHEITRKGIGRSFQITNIFKGMTAFENVRLGVMAYTGASRNLTRPVARAQGILEPALDALEAVGLADERNRVAASLSHGDQKRLEIALSLTSRPRLILLDEPTAGMNPEETRRITRLMRNIAEERGITVIFCEHDMPLVFAISQRIVVMQQGGVIADGTPDDIRCNAEVRAAYLGGETC